MRIREDFQHLLPEKAQVELVVLPKSSMRFAAISISTLALGVGIAIGTLAMGSTTGLIALVVCFIVSRVLGWRTNRHETTMLRRYEGGPT